MAERSRWKTAAKAVCGRDCVCRATQAKPKLRRMQFGSCPVHSAEGAILAHSVRADGQLLKKGRILSRDDIALLLRSSHSDVMVARLGDGDVAENEAAERVARVVAGDTVRVGAAFTGRSNLYALADGLVLIDEAALIALNAVDESITLATVAPFARVSAKQMLGTVKIIPFAAPRASVEQAERLLAQGPIVRLAAFAPRRMALISTFLPDSKPSLLDKTRAAVEARVKAVGSQIVFERRVAHTTEAVAAAIGEAREAADPILIFGASAITDRRDVIPAALEAAGGRIVRFGMPVDPGNLLLLGKIADTTVVGLPGCARSPKLNGFDFVLWRLAAGIPLAAGDIAPIGAGGRSFPGEGRQQAVERDRRQAAHPRGRRGSRRQRGQPHHRGDGQRCRGGGKRAKRLARPVHKQSRFCKGFERVAEVRSQVFAGDLRWRRGPAGRHAGRHLRPDRQADRRLCAGGIPRHLGGDAGRQAGQSRAVGAALLSRDAGHRRRYRRPRPDRQQ